MIFLKLLYQSRLIHGSEMEGAKGKKVQNPSSDTIFINCTGYACVGS